MKFRQKNKFFKKATSIALILAIVLSNVISLTVSADEVEKYPYMLFAQR